MKNVYKFEAGLSVALDILNKLNFEAVSLDIDNNGKYGINQNLNYIISSIADLRRSVSVYKKAQRSRQ